MTAYQKLCQRERERATLASAGSLLGWDERTYLPPKGQAFRGDQLALIAKLCHEQLINKQTGDLLEQAEAENLNDAERANVKGIRRLYDRAIKMPTDLVVALAKATSAGQNAWEPAKHQNDFASFKPYLETIIHLKREEAQTVGYADHPYDALVDEFEPGARTSDLKQLFQQLQEQLVPLIAAIASSGIQAPSEILERSYPVEKQRELSEQIAEQLGFDRQAGRLDVTVHPFCSGIGPGDVRITTRFNEHAFNEAFFGTLHETGHGIYEQNLPAEHFGTALGTACSLGIHESQSRWWENFVGRSLPFWNANWSKVQNTFQSTLKDVTLEQFYAAINDVRPSFIRIEADEATYNLHIILRFELEQALLTGDLKVQDLPATWNDRFKTMFGLTVPSDSMGCLQDVHWSAGLIGYFPTYTLGNLYAAQFLVQAEKDMPELYQQIEKNQFRPMKNWLVEKIHRHGQRYSASELCLNITGKPLSHHALINYLRSRFSPLYGLK
ncbi:MAG: carboxypeptidase M32 [Planctomycetia bacterium]|nr:carboxypeptidase M32 [Planctomycetia bacterium]